MLSFIIHCQEIGFLIELFIGDRLSFYRAKYFSQRSMGQLGDERYSSTLYVIGLTSGYIRKRNFFTQNTRLLNEKHTMII